MNGYYSVFNPRGEKIADCGIQKDAVNLISMRNQRWDGHYFTFVPHPGDIIDVSNIQLPPNQKYIGWKNTTEKDFDTEFIKINSQELPVQHSLSDNQQEPLNL